MDSIMRFNGANRKERETGSASGRFESFPVRPRASP